MTAERRRDGADLGRRRRAHLHVLRGSPQPRSRAPPSAPTASGSWSPSDDGTARIWDVASGTQPRTSSGATRTRRRAPRSAPTASSSSPPATTGRRGSGTSRAAAARRILSGHTGSVDSAAFSPDGKLVVTASDDGTARIWDVASGRSLHTLSGHTDYVDSVAFSPDGKLVVTASDDGTARIWDVASGRSLADPGPHRRVYARRLQPRRQARRHRQRGPDGADLALRPLRHDAPAAARARRAARRRGRVGRERVWSADERRVSRRAAELGRRGAGVLDHVGDDLGRGRASGRQPIAAPIFSIAGSRWSVSSIPSP